MVMELVTAVKKAPLYNLKMPQKKGKKFTLTKELLQEIEQSFSLSVMKDLKMSLNEYAELKKFTIALIVTGKIDEYQEAMTAWQGIQSILLSATGAKIPGRDSTAEDAYLNANSGPDFYH